MLTDEPPNNLGVFMACFSCTEIQQKIANLKALIDAYEEASLSLASGNIQEYIIDTGQTKQVVKKLDMDKLDGIIDSLYNRLTILCNRYPECTGSSGGTIIVRPSW